MTEQAVFRVVIRSILFTVLLGALLLFAWTVRSVLVLLLVATILATGLGPGVDTLAGADPRTGRTRVPRAAAVLFLYLLLIGFIALFALGVTPPLYHQAEEFVRNIPVYSEIARQMLRDLGQVNPALAGLEDRLAGGIGGALSEFATISSQATSVLRFALGLASGLLDLLLLLVLTLYLIVDGPQIARWLVSLLPEGNRSLASEVLAGASQRISSWLLGQAALSGIIGLTTFVGLTILGVPYALLLAVVAAIGELIPMVGPIFAAIPAVVIALFISPVLALLTVGLYILIQQLENNLVVPMVMRRAINLPPVVIMVSLLMGSEVLGIVGAILSLPVAAAISVLVESLVTLRRRTAADGGAGSSTSPPRAGDAVGAVGGD